MSIEQAYLTGFLKQAHAHGFSDVEAFTLAKQAGLWDHLARFMKADVESVAQLPKGVIRQTKPEFRPNHMDPMEPVPSIRETIGTRTPDGTSQPVPSWSSMTPIDAQRRLAEEARLNMRTKGVAEQLDDTERMAAFKKRWTEHSQAMNEGDQAINQSKVNLRDRYSQIADDSSLSELTDNGAFRQLPIPPFRPNAPVSSQVPIPPKPVSPAPNTGTP